MKRLTHLLLFLLLAACVQAQQAKYVFYFIGDGMGLNQVNATEMFLAEQEGRIGVQPLLFTTFPVASMATSFSATNSVTDSAAGGTALATGNKSYNGAIGVDADKNPVVSIAERAKRSGKKVGITTSVSIDHATPSAFYAHQADRNWSYEIALDAMKADFDFYGGSGFVKPTTTKEKQEAPSIFPLFEEAGYTLARGLDEYKAKAAGSKKMVLMQKEGADAGSLTSAIDRKEGDLTLAEITESAINFLTKGNSKGFFLMVEGGKIDWACHDCDAATAFAEVIDMDNAIRVAYEFYKKHPKETLIVVSADHETGGLGLASNGKYELNLKALASQKQSLGALSHAISNMRRMRKVINWEEMKNLLGETMGFWREVPVNWEQEKQLRDAFEQTFGRRAFAFNRNLYSTTEPLATVACKVMNEIAMLGWTTGGHSAAYVPVYAIGAGSQLFTGKMDNTEIPQKIAKAARYK